MSLRLIAAIWLGLSGALANATCLQEAGAMYNVNPELLRGMATVESSLNRSAINESHKKHTNSVDLGFMQINSRWLKTLEKYNITREDLLRDPCLNLKVGAWILADNMRRYGPGWTAVGAYNASCTELKGDACERARSAYVNKVWKAMNQWRSRVTKPDLDVAQVAIGRSDISRIASVDIGPAPQEMAWEGEP